MEKIVEFERSTQDELRHELRALFQGAIRLTLEMVLEEELKAMVGARRFERIGSRKDHRNGTFLRRLLTSMGQIEVAVPRSRELGSPADVMGRYRRRTEELDDMIVEAYVGGVSQRKMGEVTEALMGAHVGRSTVSRTAKRLDQAVRELSSQPIEGPHPYLYLDATYLDARWARRVENVSALIAYAVGPTGHRHLLGITIGPEESEDTWAELLQQLLERGLSGVELVIADEHAGLAAAVRRFLPDAPRQRCTVHLQRNVLAKVPRRLRKRVAREVATVFKAPGLAEAKKRLAELTTRWVKELPEAMQVLERGFPAATRF
jgi:transposase-like protein